MKKVFFIILFIPLICSSQTWPKKFFRPSNVWVKDLVETYDKGYAFISQVDAGPGVPMMYGWLIKVDINGNKLWEKAIYSNYYSTAMNGFDKTSDNGFIEIGSTSIFDPEMDVCFAKLNSCGEKEWCTILSAPNNSDYGVQVRQISDGYLGLVSYFVNWVELRIWLIKLDFSGNVIWEKVYAQNDPNITNEECRHLRVSSSGDYIITGYDYYIMPNNLVEVKPLIISADTAGNEQWILSYGSNGGYKGYLWSDIAESNSGFFYNGTGHDTSTFQLPAFIKVSPAGEEVYYKNLMQNTKVGGVTTLNVIENDSLLAGIIWHDIDDNKYIGVSKSDSLGNVTNARTLLQNTYYELESALINSDGKWVGVGFFDENVPPVKIYFYKLKANLEDDTIYTGQYTYDSLCPHAIVSDTTNLNNCNVITSLNELLHPEMFTIKIFPNPCSETVTIELPERISGSISSGYKSVNTIYHQWSGTIEIYDIRGRKIDSYPASSQNRQLEMNISGWEKGIYGIRLVHKGKTAGVGKVVKR